MLRFPLWIQNGLTPPLLTENLLVMKIKQITLILCLLLSVLTARSQSFQLGYCPDDIPEEPLYIGLDGQSARFGGAICLPASRMRGLVGGTITKMRIGVDGGISGLFAWIRSSLSGAAIVYKRMETTVEGWNEVEFDTPYTITGETIYIGFSGTLPTGSRGVIVNGESRAGSIFLSVENEWGDYADQDWGALCVQATVEGVTPGEDLALEDLAVQYPYYKKGTEANFGLRIANYGMDPVQIPQLVVDLDGAEVGLLELTDELAAGDTREYTFALPTDELTDGVHTLRAYFAEPDALPENDTLAVAVNIYTESYPKKVLLEHFTTLACVNCPYGHLTLLQGTQDRDDVVWVAHHVGYSTDELTIDASKDVMSLGIASAPLAMFDRRYIPGISDGSYPRVQIGYSNPSLGAAVVSEALNYCASVPAFASVDVTNEYDAETRALTVRVSGERNAIFSSFYDKVNLTVELVENGVRTKSYQMGGTSADTVHSNVLREVLTETFGNEVEWDGNKYEYSFQLTLPDTWNANRLRTVAFLSQPFVPGQTAATDAPVINANATPVAGTAEGVENVEVADTVLNREWYNLQGHRISEPSADIPGVYVERIHTTSGIRVRKVICK